MILNSKSLKELRSRIAFDIGNVFVHVDMDIFINELYLLGISKEYGKYFCEVNQKFLDSGMLNIEQSLKLTYPKLSTAQVKRARDAWMAVVSPCKPTLEVLTNLLAEGVEVALLSNIGHDHADYLSDICYGQFNMCIKHFSCDVGARKPSKLFYQSFIMDFPHFSEKRFWNYGKHFKSANSQISRGLFLDDKLENIDGARKYLDAKIFDITKYVSDEDAAKEMIRIIRDI